MLKKKLETEEIRTLKNPNGPIKEGVRYDFGLGEEMINGVLVLPNRIWIHTEEREILYDSEGQLIGSEKHILKAIIADDDENVATILSECLSDHYQNNIIITAVNGQEALDLFKEHGADLVITDYNMPGKDGIRLIEEIRSINEAIPVILLSGEYKVIDEFTKKGCKNSASLAKPVDPDELARVVAKLMIA